MREILASFICFTVLILSIVYVVMAIRRNFSDNKSKPGWLLTFYFACSIVVSLLAIIKYIPLS